MTVICWGTYGVCMHTGSMNMKSPEHGRIMAFLWVGSHRRHRADHHSQAQGRPD
jgi:hypothetical protein